MNINRKLTLINFNNSNRPASQIKFLVIHYVGAVSSAANNANYFYNTYRGASAHYFIDETSIWQVVEENDTAWHCGTTGRYYNDCRNSNSIGIEMCCKNNGQWYFEPATINNTIELAKQICAKYGIDRNHVVRHYDVTRKTCPEPYVRDTAAWNNFLDRVFGSSSAVTPSTPSAPTQNPVGSYTVKITTAVLNVRREPNTNSTITAQVRKGEVYTIVAESGNWGKLKSGAGWICLDYTSKNGSGNTPAQSTPAPQPKGHYVGETVTINGVYTSSSSSKKLNPNVKTGTITKIANGARNPYLLNNGNIGWTNDSCIVGSGASAPVVNTTINVGDNVRIKSSATNYVTGQKIPSWVKNNTYKVTQKKNGKCLLSSIMSWVYERDLTK